ncbi:MAG TPA: hypothetical protein VFD67_06385, partial [Gemmatimonadaceae bacterium]|nr:hypothetical protein [Gemmatimonadaceae bacterium]
MARFRPPDHSKGDANTLGGYIAVHDRPAAFEGHDGFSYSAEIVTDRTGDATSPWAAYLLFVRWARIGAQSPEGHLETDYLATAKTEAEARDAVGAWRLSDVKKALDELITTKRGGESSRRWWDAMRDDG